MSDLFMCTYDGRLVGLTREGGAWTSRTLLHDVPVQCVATDGERVLVGTRGRGALVSGNAGAGWRPVDLPETDVTAVAISEADGALYAGTEPSRLFVSPDGSRWRELTALQDIPSRPRWSFPPRPWTHHVRWIAPDPHVAERLLVGIELGGLMFSDDAGASFADHRPGAKRDVHSLAWHPRAEGRVYEAAGDGAAWSHDGGVHWDGADSGRDLGYCWALAVDPADPECWYVSAASGPGAAHRGPDARGRLYRWDGDAWHALAVPDEGMPYVLTAARDELIAGMSDGRLLCGTDRGERWDEIPVDAGPVLAMAGFSGG